MRRGIIFFIIFAFLFVGRGYSQVNCPVTQADSATPQPVPGHYYSGQTVTFCYTIAGYTQWGDNWLQGLIINCGAGWDTTTITPIVLPGSCDGAGDWAFFWKDSSYGTHKVFGPGFYYDRSLNGCLGCPGDGIPGNNLGDFTVSGSCVWYLCFSIKVKYISNGQDLSISLTATGDGTTGSWNNQQQLCKGTEFPLLPQGITSIPNCKALQDTLLITDRACAFNNGTETLIAKGGYPDLSSGLPVYNYSWSNGQTTSAIRGLDIGNYCVTVSDENNCTLSTCGTVVENNTVELTTSSGDVSCFGNCDGFVIVNATGGTGNFTYLWSPSSIGGASDSVLRGLCAGTYAVTVSDANSCQRNASFRVNQYVSLQADVAVTPIKCYGDCKGTVAAIPTNGVHPFTYSWSNKSTDSSISNLCAGLYIVTITDANGCSLNISENLTEPPEILLNESVRNVSCFNYADGYISLSPSNGVPPYAVLWAYNSLTTDSISHLATGLYNVTVTDVDNCEVVRSYFIGQPPTFDATIVEHPTSCPGATDGSLEANVFGGTTPYTYLWSSTPAQTTPIATHLPTGTYTVWVNDFEGCKFFIDTVTVRSLPLFIVTASANQDIKKYGSADLSLQVNQNGNFEVYWLPVTGLNNAGVVDPVASPSVTTTYVVEVIDRTTGCAASDSTVVTVLPTQYVFVPDAFSPNGDGVNDLFAPIKGVAVKISEFKVFDRWGNLVFSDPNGGAWNGKMHNTGTEMPVASYAWFVVYTIEGDPQTYRQQGNVTLIK